MAGQLGHQGGYTSSQFDQELQILRISGGCASSRLNHGLKPFWGGCATSRLDHGFEGPRGGCASSRLDNSLELPLEQAALAADWE